MVIEKYLCGELTGLVESLRFVIPVGFLYLVLWLSRLRRRLMGLVGRLVTWVLCGGIARGGEPARVLSVVAPARPAGWRRGRILSAASVSPALGYQAAERKPCVGAEADRPGPRDGFTVLAARTLAGGITEGWRDHTRTQPPPRRDLSKVGCFFLGLFRRAGVSGTARASSFIDSSGTLRTQHSSAHCSTSCPHLCPPSFPVIPVFRRSWRPLTKDARTKLSSAHVVDRPALAAVVSSHLNPGAT